MTTEDDFQKALVAEPHDWHLRVLFANWLEERADARAEGYRAMGLLRRAPAHWRGTGPWVWLSTHHARYYTPSDEIATATVPDDWYDLIPKNQYKVAEERTVLREALNDAARAFAQLPAARKAELLSTNERADP